jgi:hypothetical protein
VNLSPAAARGAGHNARAGFRSRAVTSFAKFQPRNANFRIHAGSGFLERQFHVVAKIRATLRTAAAAPAAHHILEPEKVAENILKSIEDGFTSAAVESSAGDARVPMTVIRGALLRIGKNRIRFRRFAEFSFRFLLGAGVAIGMPLQRLLALGRLHLFGAGALR